MNELLKEQGCVDIWIDELAPCLKESETGKIIETVVFKINSRQELKDFKKSTGWHINWRTVPADVEVYAVAIKGTREIQGLIGLRNEVEKNAVYIYWACTAPWNNKHDFGTQKYSGVGGHLFAIAVDRSIAYGYGGLTYGYAVSEEVLKHYIDALGVTFIGIFHDYHFIIEEECIKKLLEVYSYDWNEG